MSRSQKCMIIPVANEANMCNSMFNSIFKFLELFSHIFPSPVGYFWSVIHEGMFCFYILHAYFLNMPKCAKSLPNSLQKLKTVLWIVLHLVLYVMFCAHTDGEIVKL